jgi:thiamine biosynthesis lipoprotein
LGYGQLWAVFVLEAVLILAPRLAWSEWYQQQQTMMGTLVTVDLWADDPQLGEHLTKAVIGEFSRIDHLMSTYKTDSELSAINRQAGLGPIRIGAELHGLIAQALTLSVTTGGAFDITYESVVYLYDFRESRHPDANSIASRLDAIDYRAVQLDTEPRQVQFNKPGMRLNLGGIAKGYAVESGAAILRAAGIGPAVLTAGGDTRVLGDRRGQPWIVGIRNPRKEGSVVTRLPLVDEAISTSGDYERFFIEKGVRFHHIINPATGMPSIGVHSATVVGPDATITDALSTAIFVLGVERGLAIIETLPAYEAVVVDHKGELFYSDGLMVPASAP